MQVASTSPTRLASPTLCEINGSIDDCLAADCLQEKFKRGFRRLFRRCRGPLGRDRRFSSSAGEVSLTGPFHVEDVDAAGGHQRAASRRRAQRGSDASSVNCYDGQRPRSAQLTPVAVHRQQSPQPSRSTATASGTHLSVSPTVRYWPVKAGDGPDDVDL